MMDIDKVVERHTTPAPLPAPGRNRKERRTYAKLFRLVTKGTAGRGTRLRFLRMQAELARALS